MLRMVTFIGTLIFIFSLGYMRDELKPSTIMPPTSNAAAASLNSSFTCSCSASRCSTWSSPTTCSRCLSWELVGVCSFLLIGFYYERQSASTAANKAFIVNRVGDAGFLVGILIAWTYFGTFQLAIEFFQTRTSLSTSSSW